MNIDWKLLCCRIWWFCPTGCRASSQRLACLNGQMFLQLVVENCIFSGNLTSTYRSRCYRTHGLGKGRMLDMTTRWRCLPPFGSHGLTTRCECRGRWQQRQNYLTADTEAHFTSTADQHSQSSPRSILSRPRKTKTAVQDASRSPGSHNSAKELVCFFF